MQGFLTLICVMRVLSASIDGEQAIDTARHLLADVGVKDELTLQALGDHSYVTKEKCWAIEFARPKGKVFIVLDARTGRTLLLQVIPGLEGEDNHPIDGNSPPTPQGTRRQRALLHRLGYDRQVRLEKEGGFTNSLNIAYFYPTFHNHRFFNINPTYAHVMYVQPENGELVYFLPSPPLPPVNAWQPRLSAAAASRKIMALAVERMKRKRFPLPLSTEKPVMELGYWKFKKEPEARLVWRLNHYLQVNGLPYRSGSYTIFADALTGEILKPDDPAMGANP